MGRKGEEEEEEEECERRAPRQLPRHQTRVSVLGGFIRYGVYTRGCGGC